MNAEFDHQALAKSITKMLATANATVEKAGASIVTQRLIDYSSGEFGKLTPEQLLEVLKAMNPKYEANLLKDGDGKVIGYIYSGKIFVSLKDNQQKAPPWQEHGAERDAAAARTSRGRRRGQQRRRGRHFPSSNPEKREGETMSQQAGKKSQQGGGQEDYAAKYAAQYMGQQGDDEKGKKKKKDEKKSDKKSDKKKSEKKSDKKSDKKKSDKKKK